jgi:hypothetical protein
MNRSDTEKYNAMLAALKAVSDGTSPSEREAEDDPATLHVLDRGRDPMNVMQLTPAYRFGDRGNRASPEYEKLKAEALRRRANTANHGEMLFVSERLGVVRPLTFTTSEHAHKFKFSIGGADA